MRKCLDYIEEKLPGNVLLQGLFNAYTEEVMARRASEESINVPFKSIFPHGLHADSGGLQMVTLGKGTVEKEDRLKIYETQSKYADYAMSFDEIPAVFIDDTKYYMQSLIKEKGIESGNNLREQFDYFATTDTTCRIVPIVQGWGIKDTDTFAKGLFAQFSDEEKNKMDIFASGFQSTSVYASAKRAFDLYRVDSIPKNAKQHLHLLGVTGFKRLIPILILIKNNMTEGLKSLSFDSVTLSMSYVMGGTVPSVNDFKNGKGKIKLGKKRNKDVDAYWQEIFDFWKDDPEFPFDDLDDMMEHSYYNSEGLTSGYQQYEHYLQADEDKNYTKENKELADFHFAKVLKQEQYYILYQVHNYVQILESFLEDDIKLEHIFKGKDLVLFQALEKVTTDDDFNDWYEYLKKSTGFSILTMNSETKSSEETTNLLFDEMNDNSKKERKKQPSRVAKKPTKVEEDNIDAMNDLF